MRRSFFVVVISLLLGFGLLSLPCLAQTDVAVSAFGAFSRSTEGSNTIQSPSNQAGVLLEVRHIRSSLVGFEGTYSYNRANQTYFPTRTSSVCAFHASGCSSLISASVPANDHEITGDWVVSKKMSHYRLFALAGGGLLMSKPTSANADITFSSMPGESNHRPGFINSFTQSQNKGVFVYGAGVDWALLPHIGLRFEYRGNIYTAPNLVRFMITADNFTHTAEPALGIFYRF